MKSTLSDPGSRDSHWHTTQSELDSVTRRGDLVIAGAGVLFVMLALRQHSNGLAFWLTVSGLLLAVIISAVWFVASRKRRVAESRGLNCGHCSYSLHDTEIEETVRTRHCPRCASEL